MHNEQHTEGPWGLQTITTNHHGYEDWPVFCIRSGGSAVGGHCLATVGDVDRATAPKNAANARLMVAAPDLLSVVTEFLWDQESLTTPYRNEASGDNARAVLAKVRGTEDSNRGGE